jgi:hypothetical protein
MTDAAAPAQTTQTFVVVLAKKDALVGELERLAKRARRLGSMPITWTFGEITTKEVSVRRPMVDDEDAAVLPGAMTHVTRKVPFIQLTLTGAAPRMAGWTFAAVIQNLEGINILRHVPGVEREIPDQYRTRGPVCDHCQAQRNRKDTYLLVDESGRWMQVGSSCLVDFLGHEDPHAVASYAELLASAAGLCASAEDDEEGGFGFGGGRRLYALVEYLACVAAEIRESGWVPKSRVDNPALSTAEQAADRLDPPPRATRRDRSVTDADRAVAEASAEWALALDQSGEHMNDYLWNLHAVARAGVTEARTIGIAASMVAAYTKAEARKRELAARKPSDYVGEIGERRSFVLTLQRHHSFETAFGWKSLYSFRDEEDNVFVWFTSAGDDELTEGATYTVLGTIKEHEEYKGTRQTILSRCSAVEHDAAAYIAIRNEEVRKALSKKAKKSALTAEEQTQLDTLQKAAREAAREARKQKKAAALDEATTTMVVCGQP